MIGESVQKRIPQDNINEEEKILKEVNSGKSVEHFEIKITQEHADPSNEELTECLSMLNSSVLKLDGFIYDILNYSRNTST